jgi:hypothetical protein
MVSQCVLCGASLQTENARSEAFSLRCPSCGGVYSFSRVRVSGEPWARRSVDAPEMEKGWSLTREGDVLRWRWRWYLPDIGKCTGSRSSKGRRFPVYALYVLGPDGSSSATPSPCSTIRLSPSALSTSTATRGFTPRASHAASSACVPAIPGITTSGSSTASVSATGLFSLASRCPLGTINTSSSSHSFCATRSTRLNGRLMMHRSSSPLAMPRSSASCIPSLSLGSTSG